MNAILAILVAAQADPIQSVEIGKNREVRVNGKPFFPLFSWLQSPRTFPKLRGLAFNSFCGGKAKDVCDAAQKAGGYAFVSFDESFKGHPAVLAFTHGDEPDLGFEKGKPRMTAQAVVDDYQRLKKLDATRPIFLNLTADFMDGPPWSKKKTLEEKKAYYGVVAGGADILCFDVYPIYGWNRDDGLVWVADGVKQLREYGGASRPVFAFIETSKGSKWVTYDRQKDVKPEHTRAEVWMAIIRGATGIGYFTHAWQPNFTEFRPDEEMQKELKRLNEQITRLAPAILSDAAKAKVSTSITGDIMAKEYQGQLHLFADNFETAKKTATISVEKLKKGTKIEVIDENRKITAEDGKFTDEFGPLDVHLYRVEK